MITKFKNNVKSAYAALPAAVVLFITIFPFVMNLFSSNTELLDNRNLYKKPVNFTREFSKEYEAYYNDTFAYRKSLIKKYGRLKALLKFDSGAFFYGLDDWIFFDSSKGYKNATLLDYKGADDFVDANMQSILDNLKYLNAEYEKQGIQYVVMIIPNKGNVYSEYMPRRLQDARISDVSRVDRAIDLVNKDSNVRILNVKPILIAEKKNYKYDLYYKTDSHWNALGAFIGYRELIKFLALKPLPHMNKVSEVGKFIGDTGGLGGKSEAKLKVDFLDSVNTEIIEQDGERIIVYKSSNPIYNKRILLVRDSFADNMIDYFTKSFKETALLYRDRGGKEIMMEYIDNYKPDIVVDEIVERNFLYFRGYNKYFK